MSSVTVVIPAYNASRYLRNAVASIMAQNYPANLIEVVIINDGSQDDTQAVAESLSREYPQVRVFSQPNSGPAAARNHGIQKARSEWISFLDADDRYMPTKLEVAMAGAEAAQADFVYTGMNLVNGQGALIRRHEAVPVDELLPMLRYACVVVPSVMMVRKAWCEKLGGFDPGLSAPEDWDFITRAATSGMKLLAIPEPYTEYYMLSTSLSAGANWSKGMFMELKLRDKGTLSYGLHGVAKLVWWLKITSDISYRFAICARECGSNIRALSLMIKSLLLYPNPFFQPMRYKVCAVTALRVIGLN